MGTYFEEQMKNCIDDFYKFYNLDEYISKKKYETFIDKYKDIFGLINKYDNKESENYKKLLTISQNGYEIIDIKNILINFF
jgi:hypothetical protein